MAFSITSRFNILATTEIPLTLTTNPSRREHMTPPLPEFPLGPQCVPEADEFKLWAKAHSINAVSSLSLPHLPDALMGSQSKSPPLAWISLLINEGTTTSFIYFLWSLLPCSCGETCPRRSQACRFWFSVDHSCSCLQSLRGERKQIYSLDTSACKWCSPCPNRWEYMILHIPWGLRIIFLIIFMPLNDSNGWLAATLCNVLQMRQHLLILS